MIIFQSRKPRTLTSEDGALTVEIKSGKIVFTAADQYGNEVAAAISGPEANRLIGEIKKRF